MKFQELPLKEQLELRKAFDNNPEIIKLSNTATYFKKIGKFIECLQTLQEIDRQWEYLKQQHCKDYENVVEETVKIKDLNLPEDTLQTLVENIISIFICCCLIETAHFDANEALRKVNKNYSMDNFQDLVDLINNVKKKLKYLQDETGYMDDLYWYDSIDNFHTMVKNKARSIIKKKKSLSRWGQNLRKYIDGTLDKK